MTDVCLERADLLGRHLPHLGVVRRAHELAGALQLGRQRVVRPQLPDDRKRSIVEGLLESRASDVTQALVNFVVGLGRASSLPDIVDESLNPRISSARSTISRASS